MPDAFLALDAREQADILSTVAARTGRQAPILEKDVWICWALQTLFAIPQHHPMAFKGGTSLSKVYRAIDRFSEDIDITLDYSAFDDDFDPFDPGVSKRRIGKFSDRLKTYVNDYIGDVVLPALDAAAQHLETAARPRCNFRDDGETVEIAYPSTLGASTVAPIPPYLDSRVLLEFGGRNVIDPHERHEIAPDIARDVPTLHYPTATVTVLSPARTFWEKATLVHVECYRRRLANRPEKLARHWFDLARLAAHSIGRSALSDRALLEDVVRLKKVFFNAGYANYDKCLTGELRLVPDDDQLPGLADDYDTMRAAGYLGNNAPDFDFVIDQLRNVEARANPPP